MNNSIGSYAILLAAVCMLLGTQQQPASAPTQQQWQRRVLSNATSLARYKHPILALDLCNDINSNDRSNSLKTNNSIGFYTISLTTAHILLCTQQQRTQPLHNNNGSIA
mmetsp:Transcript_31334/g.51155  ORF Transcript_31334/g.51155 Transcript_31334/m.51155 type:complete len:109 (+) Transcript_31334:459-785(+)